MISDAKSTKHEGILNRQPNFSEINYKEVFNFSVIGKFNFSSKDDRHDINKKKNFFQTNIMLMQIPKPADLHKL